MDLNRLCPPLSLQPLLSLHTRASGCPGPMMQLSNASHFLCFLSGRVRTTTLPPVLWEAGLPAAL